MSFNFSDFDNIIPALNKLPDLPEVKPLPIVPNQEKQIELMTDMVNKQTEMINRQTEMINKQSELIALIRSEARESSKQSKLALFLSIIGLISGFIQTLPVIWQWIKILIQ